MARRRRMDLRDMDVAIETAGGAGGKRGSEDAAVEGRARERRARRVIKLQGRFSEQELQILRNAARYCSVSQMLSGKSVTIDDEFQIGEPSR